MGYFGLSNLSNGQAILVAPEGQDYQDDGLGWGNAGGEDIDFLHAMLDRFSAQLCIDQNRIFSTGFSFGAMFSFTLGCSQNGMMRAIAPRPATRRPAAAAKAARGRWPRWPSSAPTTACSPVTGKRFRSSSSGTDARRKR